MGEYIILESDLSIYIDKKNYILMNKIIYTHHLFKQINFLLINFDFK